MLEFQKNHAEGETVVLEMPTAQRSSTPMGAFLLLLGMILPLFVNVRSFRIYGLLNEAAAARDVGLLMVCAFLLVILNSLRALPIYLGSYLFCSCYLSKKPLDFSRNGDSDHYCFLPPDLADLCDPL